MSRISSKKKSGGVDKSQSGKGQVASAPQPERNLIFKILLILLAGLFVYAPVFHADWLWDDDQEVTASVILPDPGALPKIWAGSEGADYFPLKTSVQWVLYRFIGTDRTGWHMANIILHLVNALLVWKLLRRLGIRQGWIGGLLFVVHPILVESVAWVSELKNTLSLPFLLLSMLAFINYEERQKPSHLALSAVFYLAAILCKTSVVMFPCVLLLYGWWKSMEAVPEKPWKWSFPPPLERSNALGRAVWGSIPFFLISLIFGLLTIYFQHERAIGTETIPVGGMISRAATAGMAIWFYLYKCILPFNLLPIYPRWEVDPPAWYQFLAWPAIIGLLLWLWSKRNSWGRHALFGLGFFLINLFPVMGFIKMSYMRITWVADHFLYLPVLGLIGLAAGLADRYYDPEKPKKWVVVIGLAVFVVFTFESHRYANVFFNEEQMWSYTLKANPDAWQAHSRLGKVMIDQGNNNKAFYHIGESVRLRPDLAETHNNYGAMLEKKGEPEKALEQLREAVRIAPTIKIYSINLGSLLVRSGKYEEGEKVYEGLLKDDPDNPTFLCNRGVARYFLGRNDEAIADFQKALSVNPDLKDAKENLAAALKKKNAPEVQPVPAQQGQGLINSRENIKLFGN